MARNARVDIGGMVYHVINRAVGRLRIFNNPQDYQLFLDVLEEARKLTNMRILAFVVMPNHWHLVLYPRSNSDMGLFMHQLTNAHTRRVHAMKGTTGTGPLYQGRYKSFLIQNDTNALTVIKYVERNPVRAKLVNRCEKWKWGSAFLRTQSRPQQERLINEAPIDLPKDYFTWINVAETKETVERVRASVLRSSPYGFDTWVDAMIEKHKLLSTVRRQGRPRKDGGRQER